MTAVLKVVHERANVKQVQLSATTLIGRSPDCHLKIASSQVSRRHCQIVVRGDGIYVEDLDSANGTLLDGAKVPAKTPTYVRHGARLDVGPARFVVEYDPASKVRPGTSLDDVTTAQPTPPEQHGPTSDLARQLAVSLNEQPRKVKGHAFPQDSALEETNQIEMPADVDFEAYANRDTTPVPDQLPPDEEQSPPLLAMEAESNVPASDHPEVLRIETEAIASEPPAQPPRTGLATRLFGMFRKSTSPKLAEAGSPAETLGNVAAHVVERSVPFDETAEDPATSDVGETPDASSLEPTANADSASDTLESETGLIHASRPSDTVAETDDHPFAQLQFDR